MTTASDPYSATRAERKQGDPLHRLPRFFGIVRKRLELGRAVYRDESFSADPARLVAEVQAELADVCAWAFILHSRLERIREALECEAQRQGEAP